MDKLMFSQREVCELTGLGETFIKAETRAGRIFSVKAGDRRLYPAASVREYVAKLVAEAGAAPDQVSA